MSTTLDNLSGFWIPDTDYVYGKNREKYNLDNTQTLAIQMRLMVTVNKINPSCYMISKILDVVPKGVLKISMKADDFNEKRDNRDLFVCDYYTNSGDITIVEPSGSEDPEKTSLIEYMIVNADDELEPATAPESLDVGQTYYYSALFSSEGITAQWRIRLIGDESESDRIALERLMVIRDVDTNTISLRPGKAAKIKGRSFKLEVCDINGEYESNIEVEVSA